MHAVQDGAYQNLHDFFIKRSVAVHCHKGEVVVHAQDEPFGIFYIESGFIKVFSLNALGTQYIHVVYGPGDYFPLVWMVPDVHRNVYFEAMTPVRLLRARPDELQAAFTTNPQLCIDAIRIGVEQYGMVMDRVYNLEYRFARERLVYCLLSLARRFGTPKDGGYEVALKVSQQILASNINLSRESVGREMDRLVRKGMVSTKGGKVLIKDVPGLIKQLPGTVSTDWLDLVSAAAAT